MKVAVIGAGWAGLAAAATLAKQQISVSVFEAARQVGGRARSVEIEGAVLDNGQHILVGAYRETLQLMRSVGADPERLLLRQPLAIEYPGRFRMRAPRLPGPLHLLLALLGADGLAWGERLAAMRFMAAMRRAAYRLNTDVPLAELLALHGQTGALARYLWEPLCVSALNTPAESASAQTFLSVLRDSLDAARDASDFLIPRADLGSVFPRPAADFIRANGGSLRLGTPVRKIDRTEAGFALDDSPERHTHLVVAVGPHQLDALLQAMPELDALRRCVAGFSYEPIYTCYLQYPPGVTMPRAMTGFEGGTAQWVFDRGRLGGAPGLLAAVVSARGAHQSLAQDAVAAAIDRELAACLPGLPAPVWSRIIAEKRATYSCRPGLERPPCATAVQGLYLAGDYTAGDYPATLESAVRSGLECARLIMASRKQAR